MLSTIFNNPKKTLGSIRDRYKQLRLSIGYTQEALSERSGVSLGSLKRFERAGEISLVGLLKISAVLGCLKDFESLAVKDVTQGMSLDQIIASDKTPIRKRGVKK